MRKFFFAAIVAALCSVTATAENVKIMATGQGKTYQEAIHCALGVAAEQAFGTFISANTVILNDELVKDQLVSLQYGNIVSYEVLYQGGEDTKTVTLEAIVSTDNLIEFAKSNGSETELAGNTFATNVKLVLLNRKNAAVAAENLYNLLSIYAQEMYDFELITGEPILDNTTVYVPVQVDCKLNQNALTFYKTARKAIKEIAHSLEIKDINGRFDDDSLNKVAFYAKAIPDLQRLACYNFVIMDNAHNFGKLEPYTEEVRLSAWDVRGQKYRNRVKFIAYGFNMAPLIDPTTDTYDYPEAYNDYYKAKRKQLCYILSVPDNSFYLPRFIDELIFVPVSENKSWFTNRFTDETHRFRAGESNGSVHFLLKYDLQDFAEVSKLEVKTLTPELLEHLKDSFQ